MDAYTPQPPLFKGTDLRLWLDAVRQEAAQGIHTMDDDILLGATLEDLDEQLSAAYGIIVPELDVNDLSREKARRYLTENRWGVSERITVWRFTVPFVGDDRVLRMDPTAGIGSPNLTGFAESNGAGGGTLTVDITSNDSQPATTSTMIEGALSEQLTLIQRTLGRSITLIDEHNVRVHQLGAQIAERKAAIARDELVAQQISIPIRVRDDAERFVVPLKRKDLRIARPVAAAAAQDPVLEDEAYEQIVGVLANSMLAFERSLRLLPHFDEERVRDVLLINLNGQLSLEATGETFNGRGRTDILVRWESSNVFIGECKVWRGAKAMNEGLNQFFKYIVWRDTKAAFLLFISEGEGSDVISKATAVLREHRLYKRDGHLSERRSDFVFATDGDQQKEVKLALLPFVLPKLGEDLPDCPEEV